MVLGLVAAACADYMPRTRRTECTAVGTQYSTGRAASGCVQPYAGPHARGPATTGLEPPQLPKRSAGDPPGRTKGQDASAVGRAGLEEMNVCSYG